MRQKVQLASALLHNPELIVLDEPFSGLDVSAGLMLRSVIKSLADEGRTILMSSHVIEVVEQLCTDVVILSDGKVVAQRPRRSAAPAAERSDARARVRETGRARKRG